MKRVLAALVIVATLSCEQPASTEGPDEQERPNIILILTDDQEASTLTQMPALQRLLVARGTSFSNAFATTALCCPSRVSILRGQYAHNHGIYTNIDPDGGFNAFRAQGLDAQQLGVWMQAAGYHTAFLGKVLNQYFPEVHNPYVMPGWTDFIGAAQTYFPRYLSENGQLISYDPAAETSYATDLITRKALGIVRGAVAAKKPFFVYLNFYAPHNDSATNVPAPARRHAGRFTGTPMPRTAAFNEADVSDKPELIRSRRPLNETGIGRIDAMYSGSLEALLAVDEAIDSLVTALDQLGVRDNTYIVYMSDNGRSLGEHRWVPKNIHYQRSLRVPMIVAGPGVAAGAVRTELVLNIDIAPTFAELAGATIPAFADGRSLAPLLRGGAPAWRNGFMVEHRAGPEDERGMFVFGIRQLSWLYTEWENGERELYNLSTDPNELDNIAVLQPQHPMLPWFATWLAAFRTCAGATCRQLDTRAPPQ